MTDDPEPTPEPPAAAVVADVDAPAETVEAGRKVPDWRSIVAVAIVAVAMVAPLRALLRYQGPPMEERGISLAWLTTSFMTSRNFARGQPNRAASAPINPKRE